MTRKTDSKVAINSAALRKELKRRNVSTLILGALCGYADRAMINYYLKAGEIPLYVDEVIACKLMINKDDYHRQ